LGGIAAPGTRVMSAFGNAKSWLAIFSIDTESDQLAVLTGVGVEAGPGLPRTDTVRLTFEKVRAGSFEGNLELFPVAEQ